MFLVLLTYVKPLEEVDALLPAHNRFLDAQYAQGRFLLSGRRVPRSGGVILANVAGEAELRELLAGDPFQVAGVASYQLFEFTPTRAAPALASLVP